LGPRGDGGQALFQARGRELGITFFDTADVYSLGVSEEVTGRALRDFTRRDEVVVATKVLNRMGSGPNAAGLSRKHIMEGIDASLKRLCKEYVDLYQIHRWDPETSIIGEKFEGEVRVAPFSA
jgi:aryl-alcohol dehydrogenase-like predicted oxidoreductase